MHLSCPYCTTVFDVKLRELGVSGRLVQCGICEHEWFVDPSLYDLGSSNKEMSIDIYVDDEEEELESASLDIVEYGASPGMLPGGLPSLTRAYREEARKLQGKHALIAASWAILVLGTFLMMFYITIYRDQFVEMFPALSKIYRTIKLDVDDKTNIRNFAVSDIRYSVQFRDFQRILYIQANIENVSGETGVAPTLRLSMNNVYGHEIYQNRIRSALNPLEPGEKIPFEHTILNFPPNAADIILVFLNKSEDL